jgi:glycosyltransferase involved in cell wall biosynthesis
MKILQVIQKPQFRGAEIFACQLSMELIKLGHEVDVLFLFGTEDEQLPYPLHFIHLKGNIKKRFWDFKAYRKLNSIIVEGQYDLVQANAADTLKYTVLSKYIYNWKSKLVYRNANKISDFLTNIIKSFVNKLLMKMVDFVASVSKECMQDFISNYPSFQNRIECLPIGVSLQQPTPYQSLSAIDIEGEGPFLLHVASFVPEKNHEGLLRIFFNLLKEYPTAKLLLIGEGKLKPTIENLAFEMKIDSNIHFLGKRNDVSKIMSCCDLFVLPSLIEGLPGVILEAFINKLPVVAYDVGGIKEVLTNQETGWLIDKNEENRFFEAIKKCLIIDNDIIKNNAYELVLKNYSNEAIAHKFFKFYEKYLNI